MVLGMNDNQTRALWATALHELADAINTGRSAPPTGIELRTQFVTAGELLAVADGSYEKSLPIKISENFAWVRIPSGERLDLQMDWTVEHALATDPFDKAQATEAFRTHNAECCAPIPFEVVPDQPIGIVPTNDDAIGQRIDAAARGEYGIVPEDPCANGRCTDPVMHAEGGHDF